jgi:Ca2+-binding RTX toxin-like protein
VLEGQDGNDVVTGDAGADHVQGNGGADALFGDLPFGTASAHGTAATALSAPWPGSASPVALLRGTSTDAGQDDIVGGTPTPGFRDGADVIEGNGGDGAERRVARVGQPDLAAPGHERGSGSGRHRRRNADARLP